ncbi:BMP-binding endothelial regulator protein [Halotydeus destructor]|nr:BMP-binding endothelial regulator protein [Halotydeus destructor]
MNTCNVLKVPILRPCHRQVPIITYYRSCITDTCSCESDNCHCRAIQAYVSECRRFGIKIDSWQSVAKCTGVQPLAPAADIVPEKPRCPPGQIFSPCVNNCRKTCAALRQKSVNCNSNCSAGCQCPGNSVLHNNRCIPGKLCPSHQEVSMFYNSTLS